MKKIYLASSIDLTAKSIAKDIGGGPKKLKLAFISTASEVEKGKRDWFDSDRNGLVKAGFNLFDYTITGKTIRDFNRDLTPADIIHVNGGNTFYLLLQARKNGFDKWVKKAVSGGKIYTGCSAGSVIASPNIEITRKLETRVYEKQLKDFTGFGLVDFIVLPHWGSKHFRDLYLNHRFDFAYKPENKIILLNDWQYVKVENDMYKIVEIERQTEPNQLKVK